MELKERPFTVENYPLHTPYCLMIEVVRDGERRKVNKTFANWALAANAAGAALERLLPPQAIPQWAPMIQSMKDGYKPKIVPKVCFATADWAIDVYPEAWMKERRENGYES